MEEGWRPIEPPTPWISSFSTKVREKRQTNETETETETDGARSTSPQEEGSSKKEEYGFDWVFVKKLYSLLRISLGNEDPVPFWLFSLRRGWSFTFPVGFAFLIFTVIIQTYVVSFTGVVISGFYSSIEAKDANLLGKTIGLAILVIGGSSLLDSTVKFFIELFSWKWRGALSKHIHSKYFAGARFYLSLFQLDNPDQMITQDVENFSNSLSEILSQCLTGPSIILYYTYLTAAKITLYAPLIIYLYYFFGVLLNKLIMSIAVRLVFLQEQFEGEFRYAHARVRAYAEAIATYRGDSTEKSLMERCFQRLILNRARILWVHWLLNATTNGVSFMVTVVTYLVVALPVFCGSITMTQSDIVESAFYVMQLVSGFSMFVNVSKQLSNLAGYTHRISFLLETLARFEISETDECEDSKKDKEMIEIPLSATYGDSTEGEKDEDTPTEDVQAALLPNNDGAEDAGGSKSKVIDGDCWQFEDVCFQSPDGRVVIKGLSFSVPRSLPNNPVGNLLIRGPPGCGKSTVLRVLHGLWSTDLQGIFVRGNIVRPRMSEVMFMPQKPYVILQGTLREQLLYPKSLSNYPSSSYSSYSSSSPTTSLETEDSPPDCADENISSLLTSVGLRRLLWGGRSLDDSVNWCDMLSPGEEQLLSFARLFYHQPSFAALDESTSALPVEHEEKLYQKCIELGISLISVGHRVSLEKYHQQCLEFTEDGWILRPTNH